MDESIARYVPVAHKEFVALTSMPKCFKHLKYPVPQMLNLSRSTQVDVPYVPVTMDRSAKGYFAQDVMPNAGIMLARIFSSQNRR